MKKVIIGLTVIYIIALGAICAVNINRDKNYYNYKKMISKNEKIYYSEIKEEKQPVEEKEQKIKYDQENQNVEKKEEKLNDSLEKDEYSNIQFTRDLKKGDTGDDVKKLQDMLLKKQCFIGKITGLYGAQTKEAVKKFQKQVGITPVDGIFGNGTKIELIK